MTNKKIAFKTFKNLTNLNNAGGAKIDCVDKDGFTPLHRCCQEKPTSKDEEISGEKLDFKNRFYTSIFYCNSIFLFCNTQSLKLRYILSYKLILDDILPKIGIVLKPIFFEVKCE